MYLSVLLVLENFTRRSYFSAGTKDHYLHESITKTWGKDQEDYYFVSDNTFNQMIKGNEFAEWDQYAQHKYGSSKAEIKKKLTVGNCYAVLTANGFWHLYEYFGTVVRPIFITISKETLQSRLKNVEIHLNRFQPDWRFM